MQTVQNYLWEPVDRVGNVLGYNEHLIQHKHTGCFTGSYWIYSSASFNINNDLPRPRACYQGTLVFPFRKGLSGLLPLLVVRAVEQNMK
jgi:hypothetical protein